MRTFGLWMAGLMGLGMLAGGARAETATMSAAAYEQVDAAVASAYRDALVRFDAAQAAAPTDVGARGRAMQLHRAVHQ